MQLKTAGLWIAGAGLLSLALKAEAGMVTAQLPVSVTVDKRLLGKCWGLEAKPVDWGVYEGKQIEKFLSMFCKTCSERMNYSLTLDGGQHLEGGVRRLIRTPPPPAQSAGAGLKYTLYSMAAGHDWEPDTPIWYGSSGDYGCVDIKATLVGSDDPDKPVVGGKYTDIVKVTLSW